MTLHLQCILPICFPYTNILHCNFYFTFLGNKIGRNQNEIRIKIRWLFKKNNKSISNKSVKLISHPSI